jgi:hypothetical protein
LIKILDFFRNYKFLGIIIITIIISLQKSQALVRCKDQTKKSEGKEKGKISGDAKKKVRYCPFRLY